VAIKISHKVIILECLSQRLASTHYLLKFGEVNSINMITRIMKHHIWMLCIKRMTFLSMMKIFNMFIMQLENLLKYYIICYSAF